MACGVDFVDASFAVHATRAGQALLLDPSEWAACGAKPCDAEALQHLEPSDDIQPDASLQAGTQHASRLHGKQKTPSSKPELTAEAQSGPAEAATAAARSDEQQRKQLADKHAAGVSAKEAEAPHRDTTAMRSMADTHQASANYTDAAKGVPPTTQAMQEGLTQPKLQCVLNDSVQHGSLAKCHSAHGKRGLAEQAPPHVKHPRHRLDDAQEHPDGSPGVVQHASSAAADAGSAASRRGVSKDVSTGARESRAKQHGAEPAPGTAQLHSRIALDMYRQEHRADKRPLGTHCACYTCCRHSRAYVHHLLQTKEILAQVSDLVPEMLSECGMHGHVCSC